MSSKRKTRKNQQLAERGNSSASWSYPFALGALVAGALVFAAMSKDRSRDTSVTSAAGPDLAVDPLASLEIPSLGDFALMSAQELERQDLALINLRCAEGLPGSEELDVRDCFRTLSRWASAVRRETDRHLYKFAQHPAEYENSEGYFRMMMLITVLQQDFGVHYNEERIREVDFTNSRDLFIHGMIGDGNGGTCVSMPVLYTAIARRLGYPVQLVTANGHVFCRWEDKNERFNIEATSHGMSSFDDDYYMSWPKPLSKEAVERGWFLKSLTNAESLACFLAARGHCQADNSRLEQARVSYALAAEKSFDHPNYRGFLVQSLRNPGRDAPKTIYNVSKPPLTPTNSTGSLK